MTSNPRLIITQTNISELHMVYKPRPASREAKVAGDEGKLAGAAFAMLLTTAGEPGPRSMRLSSVASLRTCD